MATVFDVAKYILNRQGEMATWKLQKLCYYCQAWHLAWTGRELFPEDFQAWRNGPVCPELYRVHAGKFSVAEADIDGDINAITDDERESIDPVLDDYGTWEPYDLRMQTHAEDPWRNARGGLPPDANCTVVIPKAFMGEYYGAR